MELIGTKRDGTVATLRQHKGDTYFNLSINTVHQIRKSFGLSTGERAYVNMMVADFDAFEGEFSVYMAPSDRCSAGFQPAPHYRGYCGIKLPSALPTFGNQRLYADDMRYDERQNRLDVILLRQGEIARQREDRHNDNRNSGSPDPRQWVLPDFDQLSTRQRSYASREITALAKQKKGLPALKKTLLVLEGMQQRQIR